MTLQFRLAHRGLTIAAFGIAICIILSCPDLSRAQSPAQAKTPPSRPYGASASAPTDIAAPAEPSGPSSLPAGLVNNWTTLTNLPGFSANTALLLTDGRILVQNTENTDWHLLTPDNMGSYINGTWSAAATTKQCLDTKTGNLETYAPLYAGSAVLPDGRVVVIGGEYNLNFAGDTNLGEIYDPVANAWSCLTAPSGWNLVGDAMSIVLPNGTFQLGNFAVTANLTRGQVATLNASTNPPSWTIINPTGKSADNSGYNNEEGWTLLPNGNVFTLEVWNSADNISTPALQYNPSTQAWTSAGTAPDPLVLLSKGSNQYFEIGPAVLRPDGTVFASGATGNNDIYNSTANTWASGPTFPTAVLSGSCKAGSYNSVTEQFVAADAPAALLPNGNVLIEASPVDATCQWIPPSEFFEFDGTNLTQVAATTNSPRNVSFNGRLLTLPTGQLFFTDATGDAEIYTATGSPNSAWAPTIASSPATVGAGGTNMKITGTQFNGLSGAVAYGDDYQAATNYPLVRITNLGTGHVFYARTHGHSTMGIATGATPVSTFFDVPANIELGSSTLVVVANGIPSTSVPITVLKPGATALGSSQNPSANGQSVTFTATVTGTGGTPTGTVTFYDGMTSLAVSLGTVSLNGSGVATLATSALLIGSHSITAQYNGDSNFGPTTSIAVTQTVNGNADSIALVTSLNPVAYGQSVTFTATMTGTGGTPTGTVTFLDANSSLDGNTVLGTATLSGVTAALTVTSSNAAALLPGTHSITAKYNGDTVFGPVVSAPLSLTVNPIPTTTALVSSSNPSTLGQSVTFTATVASTSSYNTPPTGTVTFLDGGTSIGTGTLNSSRVATLTTSNLTGGPAHSITSQYGGDASFSSSTSSAISQKVFIPTGTAAISSVNPSTPGQSVTFTATVTASSGTPTGTITFLDAGSSIGTGTLNGSGVATLATSSLAGGSHAIVASYGGDANYSSSSSAQITQTVLKPTTSALVSSQNPSVSGQQVTFTATVTGAGGTPTGTASFVVDSNAAVQVALNGSGVAAYTTTVALTVGLHSVTATYGGDSNFSGSASAALTQQVGTGVASATALTSSPNPSTVGQQVTFTATVNGAGGPPTGTVTFSSGGTALGTGTLTAGIAIFTTSTLASGSRSITATYGGDLKFGLSTSAPLNQVVNTKPSTTALVSSLNPAVLGQQVTFTATVTGTGGTPTGNVNLLDGSAIVGASSLNSSGVATFTPTLNIGSHTITAQYLTDGTFASSTSPAVTQVINGKPTTIVVASSLNPSIGGQSVTFTATASGTGGTPTGTVTFMDGANSLGTGALNGSGVASLSTSLLSVASHSITAVYGGDSNFAGSTSSPLSQTVAVAGFAPVVTSPTVTAGQSSMITITAFQAPGSSLSFALSCLGLPAKATCQFSNTSVTPGPPPTGTPVILTFGTASSQLPGRPSNRSPWPWGALGILSTLAALMAAARIRRQSAPSRRLAFSSCLACIALAMIMMGCGSGYNTGSSYTGTPKGPATFTVTGTSGATTISTSVTVTVQ